MPDSLPIIQLTLYKHGIGVITRRGRATGRELSLPFPAGDVDDVLKSLIVIPLDGGQVTGIRYVTPRTGRDDDSIFLAVSVKHTLFDLLQDLRGVSVSLMRAESTIVQGRVLGMEEHPQGREFGATVIVLTNDGGVEQIATDRIMQLKIADERAEADLSALLNRARPEDPRRALVVSLTEADREIQVSYSIPSPVWRVSYRFVGETSDGNTSGLLQGWGIFDNHLGEDLVDVEVALVAGQPVSFRYDLTSSIIPVRPLVQDEARVAAAPVEFAGAMNETASPAMSLSVRESSAYSGDDMYDIPAFSRRREPRTFGTLDTAAGTQHQSEGRELDELFEYRIPSVSVGRDESAMVPIVQYTSGYRRELLYNGQKHRRHPVAALRFRNESGLTLERGPVTIMEDGDYRGEAILPFTKQGAEIVLAYAIELGVGILEDLRNDVVTETVELVGALLHIGEYHVQTVTHTLINTTGQEQVVTIERRIWWELHESPQPDEDTGEFRRWRVTCAPHEKNTFVIRERELLRRHERIEDHSAESLAAYLREHGLNEESRTRLATIIELRTHLDEIDRQLGSLTIEQEALGARQERLRRNLQIDVSSESETEIRRRSSEDFRRTQDREDAILAEIERLHAERGDTQRRLAEAMV